MGLKPTEKKLLRSLGELNKTELVQLLQEAGIRSHRGTPKKTLARTLVTFEDHGEGNPFDSKRDVIMAFLHENWDKIQSQLSVSCHADCYEHTDMQVLACWISSRQVLEGE